MDLLERFAPLMAVALHCAGSAEGLAMPLEDIQARLLATADEERGRPALEADGGLLHLPGEHSRELEDARFAVYAWADEKILNAPRSDADGWLPLSLQCYYFSTTEGGQQFFSRLDAVLDALGIAREVDGNARDLAQRLEAARGLPVDSTGTEVLRVFALCLLYGFRGRLHGRDDLLARIRKICRKLLHKPKSTPVPVAPSTWEAGQTLLQRLESAAYVVVPVVVCVLFWLLCANILAHIPGQGG